MTLQTALNTSGTYMSTAVSVARPSMYAKTQVLLEVTRRRDSLNKAWSGENLYLTEYAVDTCTL